VNILFTFETISATLNCEMVFKELRILYRIIPVPRALDSSCAYAIITEAADIDGLCEQLGQKYGNYKKVFRVAAGTAGNDVYEEIR
jgi:hypothetical protein